MDDLRQYKYKVERGIVEKAINEFEKGNLIKEDLKAVADFTVEDMKKIGNRSELSNFLKSLSVKWPIFENIAMIEEGDYKEIVEDEVYSGVLTLAQNGKIDSAIRLAKTVTS